MKSDFFLGRSEFLFFRLIFEIIKCEHATIKTSGFLISSSDVHPVLVKLVLISDWLRIRILATSDVSDFLRARLHVFFPFSPYAVAHASCLPLFHDCVPVLSVSVESKMEVVEDENSNRDVWSVIFDVFPILNDNSEVCSELSF